MAEDYSNASDQPAFPAADGLNSPDLSSNLKPRMRALEDEQQICNFVKRMVEDNRERNIKNARIMSKYNAEKPYAPGALANEGLNWKSNFSSQPLATLIDRIAPRFLRAVNSVRSLTNAKLPDDTPDAVIKTDAFRRKFTELVRNRVGWVELVSEVAMENALFGYTSVGHVDETSWFPRHFRQDEFFVPAITKQNSKFASAIVFRDPLLINQVFELISDKEAAITAGWNIENTVSAINKAMPENMRSATSGDMRKYEDLYRESNLYLATAQGSKVVVCYHVFTTEVTGKISHYIVDGVDWKLLFKRHDRFDSMTQVSTFFSFQQAQGKLMASKGVGRTVYMLAGIVDRSRNEIIDRFQLSGKVLLQGDEKDIQSFRMSVIGAAVMISNKFKLSTGKIDAGVDAFKELDVFVRSLMDEISGNVSPAAANDLQGERVTNGQVNFIADLQNEGKDVKIERFLIQLSAMLTEMQRRACSDDTEDDDAKEFQGEMHRIMTKEEFAYLAKQPTSRTVDDLTDQDRQIKVTVCGELANNPLVDQKKVLRHKLVASVGEEFAQDVLLPDNDPTVTAEQTRLQMIENLVIKTGEEVPVSPRDAHQIHLQIVMPEIEKTAGMVGQDVQIATILREFVDHAKMHLNAWIQSGAKDPAQAQISQILSKVEAGLQQLAQAAQAQVQQSGTAPAPGAPQPQATPTQ